MSAKKSKQPRGERTDALRAYFVRLFGKYDFRNEEHFLYFGKWLSFILLLLVESLIVLQLVDGVAEKGGVARLFIVLSIVVALSISMSVQLFAVKKVNVKLGFYAVNAIAACAFLFFVDGTYSLLVYMLILTQAYFETEKPKHSVLLLSLSVLAYIAAYGLQYYLLHGVTTWNVLKIIRECFGFIYGIVAHFIAVQIILAFYRQYAKLDKALKELGESQEELQKAYAVVAEVTALEERQRIAKEIHDTVGHSLTTVVMQTESAKRVLDSNPEEAKAKIVSANLRARQALEEIRDGVHLLSGNSVVQTLESALVDIIHESSDGTGIKFRSSITNVPVSSAKHRFLCNALKEGIANGLRHGGATAFWFELKEEAGEIFFLLSDNGKGVSGELREGFGLTTMQQRARALGGDVSFYCEAGEGFEIRVTLPVDNEKGE